jgi:hypothetical protein
MKGQCGTAARHLHPRHMRAVHRLVVWAAAVVGGGAALAQEATTNAAHQIYQQRTADGRIVLSDRPLSGAQTQRTWQYTPEDAAAAQQRRDVARREAAAVSERIQRQLEREQQRAEELALERLRLAQAQAQRDAERARYEAQSEPVGVVFVPRRAPHIVPPFPPPRLPRFPRPGPPDPRMKDAPLTPVAWPTRG